MKFNKKKMLLHSLILSMAMAFDSYAFYNNSESIKGIVTEHVEMVALDRFIDKLLKLRT